MRAKLEEERKAREEAERRAKEQAERERQAREEAERKTKEEAERERKETEEKTRREVDELRAKLEQERNAREEAERNAKEQTERERKARDEAERKAKEQGERERNEMEEKARREADDLRAQLEKERKAREDAERRAKDEAERKARQDAERKAKEHAERSAKEHADRVASEAEARARQEAEELSRKDAEENARSEADAARAADESVRRAAEEQAQAAAKAGPSLDDLVKIEIDFDAVQSATKEVKLEAAKPPASADENMLKVLEEKARRDAEEQARNLAEEKASMAADAEEKRDEEDRRRKDEQAAQPRQVKDRAFEQPAAREQEYAAAKAQLEAQNEETERHFADMEKELEAEAAAATGEKTPPEPSQDARKRDKETARERVRAEAAVHAETAVRADEDRAATEETRVVYRTPINWGKPVALALFLILILGLVLIHFVSFDGRIPQFEKLAGAHLQQPVKIKALHLSLLPLPHWRLDGVSVGNEGQLAVAQITAVAALGSMFSDQMVFKSIELESPVLSEQGLIALLFAKSQGQDFKVASVIVRNGKLDSKTIVLPVLDAKIAIGDDGAWQKIALETPDHKTSLLLEPKGEGAQLEVETNAFSMPFGPAFILENFSAKGVIGRNELRLSEFKGAIYGGYLSGNASLKWGTDWSLGGEISARAIDPGSTAPALLEDGKLEGKAVYAMRAKSYDELFAAPRLEGTFAVQKGSLLGVDLARLLQSGGVGGKTAFAELTGSFVREGPRTQLRQVRLSAGPVSAGGSADVDAGKNISGRFVVELKSPVAQARVNLAVSGTLREPRFNR